MRINNVSIIKSYLSAVNGGYVSRMSRLFTPTGGVGSGRYDEGGGRGVRAPFDTPRSLSRAEPRGGYSG